MKKIGLVEIRTEHVRGGNHIILEHSEGWKKFYGAYKKKGILRLEKVNLTTLYQSAPHMLFYVP